MSGFFAKIVAFVMAALSFLFPWIFGGKTTEDLTIQLEANATTGYTWVCVVEDETIVKFTGSKYVPALNVGGLVGVGGTENFYFSAASSGTTNVTFTYKQNWDGGATAQTVVYAVTVDSDKKVTAVKISDSSVAVPN